MQENARNIFNFHTDQLDHVNGIARSYIFLTKNVKEVKAMSASPQAPPSASKSGPEYSVYKDEIVKRTFGKLVGKVMLDFSCGSGSYTGRMYVCELGTCFYSNMFNFERKIRIFWKDIVQLEKNKIAGIQITHLKVDEDEEEEEEVLLFTAVQFRDSVFSEMERLWNSQVSLQDSSAEEKEENEDQSELLFRAREVQGSEVGDVSNLFYDGTKGSKVLMTSPPTNFDLEWQKMRAKSFSYFQHVAHKDSILPSYPLEDFFDLFLADDATFSIKKIHLDMGDSVIKETKWKVHGADQYHRTKDLVIRRSVKGYGEVTTTKSLHLRFFGSRGICIDQHTKSSGVPYADCFIVQYRMMLEVGKAGPDSLTFTAFNHCVWIKPALLKAFPEQAANASAIVFFKKFMENVDRDSRRPKSIIAEYQHRKQVEQHRLKEYKNALFWIAIVSAIVTVVLLRVAFKMRDIDDQAEVLREAFKELKVEASRFEILKEEI